MNIGVTPLTFIPSGPFFGSSVIFTSETNAKSRAKVTRRVTHCRPLGLINHGADGGSDDKGMMTAVYHLLFGSVW